MRVMHHSDWRIERAPNGQIVVSIHEHEGYRHWAVVDLNEVNDGSPDAGLGERMFELRLDNGTPLNRIDDDTFQIVTTGVIIKRK